jgi:hypothetical protein
MEQKSLIKFKRTFVEIEEQKELDKDGRCCGKKPLEYKTSRFTGIRPHKFCTRCDRAFDIKTGKQIENWAWKEVK